jgi:hypothetical protein
MWNGTSLAGVPLKALGLRIPLGHQLGDVCPSPVPDNHFTILNAHGVHAAAIDYCGCPDAPSRSKQLMAARFQPGSSEWKTPPSNAVAFELAYLQDAWTSPVSMRQRGSVPMKRK